MAVLRSTLFGGLISNLVTNLGVNQNRVRLFETGRSFHRDEQRFACRGVYQPWKLAGGLTEAALP